MTCARCPRVAFGSLVLCSDCITALVRRAPTHRDGADSPPAIPPTGLSSRLHLAVPDLYPERSGA